MSRTRTLLLMLGRLEGQLTLPASPSTLVSCLVRDPPAPTALSPNNTSPRRSPRPAASRTTSSVTSNLPTAISALCTWRTSEVGLDGISDTGKAVRRVALVKRWRGWRIDL